MELDMDHYRKLIASGIKKLAFMKALDHLRPRKKRMYDDDAFTKISGGS